MKTAEELQALAKQKASEQIAKVFDGAKEHMIKRCQEEAEKGLYKYMFTSDGVHETLCCDLLQEFIKIAYEFEENGFIVKITRNNLNPYYNYLNVYITWGNNGCVDYDCYCLNTLYDTCNGINKNNVEKLKRI